MKKQYCRDCMKVTPKGLFMAVNATKLSEVFGEQHMDKIAETIVGEPGLFQFEKIISSKVQVKYFWASFSVQAFTA